jgi:hypothetical protein
MTTTVARSKSLASPIRYAQRVAMRLAEIAPSNEQKRRAMD